MGQILFLITVVASYRKMEPPLGAGEVAIADKRAEHPYVPPRGVDIDSGKLAKYFIVTSLSLLML